ncbi:MAG: HD domain-containing protein [Planctomycetota bacterium]|jgi:HD superfamily phosphohydrolase|nr:HD domain-containing protein [Planctomycetota bacterium]
MAMTYEIRDPIHRHIVVTDDEIPVLDSPWIQRLRHIRQLGFVSVVYPGAVHDRFQHSIGVMHLAGECFRKLVAARPEALRDYVHADLDYAGRVIRFAGLLHDAGHAPFSHTSEAWFPQVETVRLPPDWYRDGHQPGGRQATHEDFTLAIIARMAKDGALEENMARDVAAVLSSDIRRSPRLAALGSLSGILRALVSGEMDADRCDYLLRDSHFTGVSYGVYDLPRLMSCLTVIAGPDGPELGLDIHGVFALESLLLARYHMFQQVYFHKTPPAFEYYLGQAIEIGEVPFSLARGLDDLISLRDDHVIAQLHMARDRGDPWSRRIVNREPAKLVLRERMGAEQQENFLAQQLRDELTAAGCHVFARRSRQRFTRIAGAGDEGDEGQSLLCERRILGHAIVEPVTLHSELLARFNQPIDLQHTYVLAEDGDRARTVMERLQAW